MTPPRYEEPYQDPNNPWRMDRDTGKCHMCQEVKPITYCSMCEHWLCREDRNDYYARPVAAFKQAIHEILVKLWVKQDKGPCCGLVNAAE